MVIILNRRRRWVYIQIGIPHIMIIILRLSEWMHSHWIAIHFRVHMLLSVHIINIVYLFRLLPRLDIIRAISGVPSGLVEWWLSLIYGAEIYLLFIIRYFCINFTSNSRPSIPDCVICLFNIDECFSKDEDDVQKDH
jgi:hypothetical protein